MQDADPVKDRLLVALQDKVGYVQVCGRGTFKVSSALKKFGLAAVESGCTRLLMDMAACVGMDSTFMGVIAGLATELKRARTGEIVMVNLSEKTRGLLATLGLDQVVQVHLEGCTPADVVLPEGAGAQLEALEAGDESRCATAETMLEAHENLVEMSPENYPRFKDVLTFLREDLDHACEDEEEPGGGG